MPNMCIAFFVSMFVTALFFISATVHTTLPLTSSFLISLAVQFLCVSRFCFCVLSGAVYVYVYLCHVCLYVSVSVSRGRFDSSLCLCQCLCLSICMSICVWSVSGKMVNAP